MSVLYRPPIRAYLLPLALAVLVLGCSDSTGVRPPSGAQLSGQGLHLLAWQQPATLRFSAHGQLANRGAGLEGIALGSTSDDLSLERNSASFWAVRGESRSVQINYQSGSDVSHPFLRLATSDPTYAPAQGAIAMGDSVLITITVDPTNLKVTLEPSGLQFGTASRLDFWYGGAGGDMNGDGVVDDVDAGIEAQVLGLWYRENSLESWTELPAEQSLSDKSFVSQLLHFCDFAVSFKADYAVSW